MERYSRLLPVDMCRSPSGTVQACVLRHTMCLMCIRAFDPAPTVSTFPSSNFVPD